VIVLVSDEERPVAGDPQAPRVVELVHLVPCP
jgi:hypothetical protein